MKSFYNHWRVQHVLDQFLRRGREHKTPLDLLLKNLKHIGLTS